MRGAPLFTPDELARLNRLRARKRRMTPATYAGDWRSDRFGSSGLFADYRDYVVGDDLRHVDWNVYARLGDLVVKRYEAMESAELVMLVDRSSSMLPARARMARRLAGAIGYIALAHMDQVQLSWMPTDGTRVRERFRGRRAGASFLKALAAPRNDGATDHATTVRRVIPSVKRQAMAIVLSDFYDPHHTTAALARLHARGLDVVALHLTDRSDVDFQIGDSLRITDAETGETLRVDVTDVFLDALQASWRRRAESLQRWCVEREIAYQPIDVHGSLWDALRNLRDRGIALS